MPSPPANDDQLAAEHVIGIVGPSFCGSTVANLVLDGHPSVHGAGELIRLFRKSKDRRCSIHLDDCDKWTPEAFAAVHERGLYSSVARMFGRRVIADSSKRMNHFESVRPLNPGVRFTFVLMVKHPLRYAASNISNKLIVGRRTIAAANRPRQTNEWQEKLVEFARESLEAVKADYADMGPRLAKLARDDGGYLVLRYEDFATDPLDALAPALGRVGLEPAEAMLDWMHQVHHPIGGNRGPLYQLNRDLSVKRFVGYRKSYYEESPGLALDDKYRDAFTGHQLELITALPVYRELCEQLEYDPDEWRTGRPGRLRAESPASL